MSAFRKLYRDYAPKYIPMLCLYTLLAIALSLCSVYVTRQVGVISDAAQAVDLPAIVQALIATAILTALQMAMGMGSTLLGERLAGRVRYNIRKGIARYVALIPFKALSARKSGDVLSLYANDAPSGAAFITTGLFELISELALLLAAVGFMVALHPLYSLIFFALYPPLAYMQVLISKPIQPLVEDTAKRKGEYNAVVMDSLQNTTTVIAYSLEEPMERRYDESYDTYFKAQMKRIKVFTRLVISGLLATFAPGIFLAVATAFAVISGDMTIGMFIALITLSDQAGQFLMMLSQRLSYLRTTSASGKRLIENMQDPEENLEGEKASPKENAPAYVLDGVTFRYTDEEDTAPALDNIHLTIAKGSRVAIVGASGSGKSTLSKLMQTLYDPQQGSVLLLGQDTAKTPKDSLRQWIACVPQDTFLFPESIRQNITCNTNEQVDEERLRKASSDAGILSFIEELPDGFETVLAEGGENLSGGQRQRLSIARALYRDSSVLLLDEATSALDPATEKSVLQALLAATKNKTVVVVAHRLAAIADCDRILVMDGGRIIEDGTFEDLMGKPSAFAALYQKQIKEGIEI